LSSAPFAPAAAAAVILLGDQPLVQCDVIRTLVAHWRRTGLTVRPRYGEHPLQPGHPVVLDRGFWPLVRELEGDTGLGAMLRSRPEAVTMVDVPGSNPDVDRLDDLSMLDAAR
jgi:molybdenum cofactor cytidylyltransferase